MLKSHGRDVKGSGQQAIKGQVSNKNITEWTNAHGVPLPNPDGVASQQLSYIAFNKLAANKDKYNAELALVMKPFEAEKNYPLMQGLESPEKQRIRCRYPQL